MEVIAYLLDSYPFSIKVDTDISWEQASHDIISDLEDSYGRENVLGIERKDTRDCYYA